jgi:hypothetical protein
MMMLMSKIVLTALVLLVGCATTVSMSEQALQIKEIARAVANDKCQFLGVVSGSSGWGGAAAATGVMNAKAEALNEAAEKDATHIAWIEISGGFTTSVKAHAYRCN